MFLIFPAILLVVSFGVLARDATRLSLGRYFGVVNVFSIPQHKAKFTVTYIFSGVKSFCIATSAKEGEAALISCHFDTDINKVQKAVLLYVFKVNKKDPVFILSWSDGKPHISTDPGYEWGGTISDHTIIKIPKANPDQAGEYKCIVPPSESGDARGCTLNILGIKNNSLLTTFGTTKLSENAVTSLVPKRSSAVYADTEGTNENLIAIILGVAFGVVIFVIIVVAVVAVRKRWIRVPCMIEEQQEISNTTTLADRHLLSSGKQIH